MFFLCFLGVLSRSARAGQQVQQHQAEEVVHRNAGLPAEHHQRLLEDGVPGEFTSHRHDHQGGGKGEGEAQTHPGF